MSNIAQLLKPKRMKKKFYVLFVWGDVDPDLIGPFDTDEARDEEAKEKRYQEGDEHGYYWMDVDEEGIPNVGSYTGSFFEE